MGSFSASCGITKLTIGCGDKCLLLPLIPAKRFDGKMKRENHVFVKSTHLFVYNTDMWEPFCLPIEGRYDDYGSLEDIVKNENTKILEKYFGMTIEEFVSLITDGRSDVYDRYSSFSNMFLKYPEDIGYDVPIKDFLLHLGFVENENIFTLEDKCIITMLTDDKFKAKIGDDEKEYSYFDKDDFLNDYLEKTGEYLGIKEGMLEKMLLIDKIGGMFMLKEAYDFYAKNNLSKDTNIVRDFDFDVLFLKDLGFSSEDGKIYRKKVNEKNITVTIKGRYDNTINRRKFYDMKDFIECYEDITGETLDLSKYNGVDSFDWQELVQRSNDYKALKDYIKMETLIKPNTAIDLDNIDEIADYVLNHERLMILLEPHIYLPYFCVSDFGKMDTIRDIYMKDIIKCNCLSLFTEFKRLLRAMNLSNILFVPSFCGTQCGCNEAEFKLAFITNKIVNDRIKELKEDLEDDYKEINPYSGFNARFY